MPDKSMFQKIDHIGVVVKSLEDAVKYYESLGISPFKPLKISGSRLRMVYGKSVPINSIQLKTRNCKLGSVCLELLEPAVGESLWKEYLRSKGEGINHIAFAVDDIDAVEKKLIKEKFPLPYSSRFIDGGGDAYMATDKIGGVIFTPVQWPALPDEKAPVKRTPLAKLGHVGLVVKDVDKTVAYYESLGLGPFEAPMYWVSNKWVDGKPVAPDSIVNKERILKIGDILIQIIQPVKGDALWSKFLKTRGEGVNHLAFHVKDIDKQEEWMVKKTGLSIPFKSRFPQGGGSTYFDATRVGGTYIEFIEWVDPK